jgi:hypothetical protein
MSLAYGLKTRLIFTTDTAKSTEHNAVQSSTARGDFTLKPEEIRLDNVHGGSLYDVEEQKGVVLEITNPSDHEQSYRLQSLPVSASLATLVAGFSETPDASYLKFSDDRVVVGPHQTKTVRIYLDVPAKKEYRGKHYMFVVRAVAEGEGVVASVYSRLLTSIQ